MLRMLLYVRVTVVIVHIGHEDVVCRHIILRSHFCRDFLYHEMFSLHLVLKLGTIRSGV